MILRLSTRSVTLMSLLLFFASAPILAQDGAHRILFPNESVSARHWGGDLRISRVGDRIILEGRLSSASEKDWAISYIRRIFPLLVLQDELNLDPSAQDISSELFRDALRRIEFLSSGTVTIIAGEIITDGQAMRPFRADAFDAAAAFALEFGPDSSSAGAYMNVSMPASASAMWSATRVGETLQFSGLVPSSEAHQQILEATREFHPGIVINDQMELATGAVAGFSGAARAAIAHLGQVDSGRVLITGADLYYSTDLSASGSYPAFSGQDAELPPGFTTASYDVRHPVSDRPDPRVVELLYATNRSPDAREGRMNFSSQRNTVLSFGAARVRIPEDHRIGQIELPGNLFSFQYTRDESDPAKHFILTGVESLSRAAWLQTARTKSAASGEALVFVHGFNNDFDDAVFRLAQIVWDLQYQGVPVLFSWPSKGELESYIYDQSSAMASRPHFLDLLETLQADAGVSKVHVIAHSMGSMVALETLSAAANSGSVVRIGELILAAPDVDRDVFRSIAADARRISGGVTIYASSVDRAMTLSRNLAQSPRAGDIFQSKPILVADIDSVDVSAMGDEIFGLNHNTFASRRSLINDMALIIRHGMRPPHERLVEIRAVPEGAAEPEFWRYVN